MKRFLLVLVAALALGACSSEDNPTGPSSLEIVDVTVGTGAQATVGDTVTVHYTGAFLDGRVFDSSVGRAPFTFRTGTGAVIPGFEQGIIGMRVGGKRRITVPSDLAYGRSGQGPIPPNTPLMFDIELVAVTR
jgi:FKBP-type peptidyl-prolyl cis-trans isomerase FkpA